MIKKRTILHGEAMITECELPSGAKPLEIKGSQLVIAPSETTGNHHVVENAEGCEFFVSDGVRYMKNSGPTNVKCVHPDRHDDIEIPAGTWEFGAQREYDYFEQSHQQVRD
jgi:hypothetical protein